MPISSPRLASPIKLGLALSRAPVSTSRIVTQRVTTADTMVEKRLTQTKATQNVKMYLAAPRRQLGASWASAGRQLSVS